MAPSTKKRPEETEENQPQAQPLLVEALGYLEKKDEALDLGAGALNDSKHLLGAGFKRVTAVDMDPASKEKAKEISLGGFSFVMSTYEQFKFPKETYDIVNAQYALPFNPPGTFNEVIRKVIASLKPEGIFVGQFFGDRDTWNFKDGAKVFHTIDDARKLLSSMRVLKFEEEEEDRELAPGHMKHWHVFHFIAVK